MVYINNILALLKDRGVYLHEIAKIVYDLQAPFSSNLNMEKCINAVESVVKKREVQYTVLTGLALDMLAEEGKLPSPLQEIIAEDNPLYGLDEVLSFGITNLYGTIGMTSFGYLDKSKPGVIGELNNKKEKRVNTFLDDIVSGIAAAASAKIAHELGT